MGPVPDEGTVQEPAAASPDPAFSDRVHAGHPDITEHGPDPGIGEGASNAAVKSGPRLRIMNLTWCA